MNFLKCWLNNTLIACVVIMSKGVNAEIVIPALPEAVTNNAVAKVKVKEDEFLLSFNGLGKAKNFKAVHNKVWAWKRGEQQWVEKSPVPASTLLKGRLASVAVGVGRYAYIFGGYTVAEDHSEVSVPDVYRYDIANDSYKPLSNMPVPVDDSVALNYRDQYIYLVSGWHNDGNVNLVQVYDIKADRWQQASSYPGAPVFGHAGAILNDKLVICDGVAVKVFNDRRRSYRANPSCYFGQINPSNPLKIDWRSLPHYSGVARYRMAASADKASENFIFLGGTNNPYNYNGTGYDGIAAEPKSVASVLNAKTLTWRNIPLTQGTNTQGTMDHRGLLFIGGAWVTIGGMGEDQKVLHEVIKHNVN